MSVCMSVHSSECICVCAFNRVCDLNPLGVANQYRQGEYWQALIKDSLSKPSVSCSSQNGHGGEENTSFFVCIVCVYVCVCVCVCALTETERQ